MPAQRGSVLQWLRCLWPFPLAPFVPFVDILLFLTFLLRHPTENTNFFCSRRIKLLAPNHLFAYPTCLTECRRHLRIAILCRLAQQPLELFVKEAADEFR